MAIGGPGDGVLETMDLDPELVHDLGLYELHDEFIDGDPLERLRGDVQTHLEIGERGLPKCSQKKKLLGKLVSLRFAVERRAVVCLCDWRDGDAARNANQNEHDENDSADESSDADALASLLTCFGDADKVEWLGSSTRQKKGERDTKEAKNKSHDPWWFADCAVVVVSAAKREEDAKDENAKDEENVIVIDATESHADARETNHVSTQHPDDAFFRPERNRTSDRTGDENPDNGESPSWGFPFFGTTGTRTESPTTPSFLSPRTLHGVNRLASQLTERSCLFVVVTNCDGLHGRPDVAEAFVFVQKNTKIVSGNVFCLPATLVEERAFGKKCDENKNRWRYAANGWYREWATHRASTLWPFYSEARSTIRFWGTLGADADLRKETTEKAKVDERATASDGVAPRSAAEAATFETLNSTRGYTSDSTNTTPFLSKAKSGTHKGGTHQAALELASLAALRSVGSFLRWSIEGRPELGIKGAPDVATARLRADPTLTNRTRLATTLYGYSACEFTAGFVLSWAVPGPLAAHAAHFTNRFRVCFAVAAMSGVSVLTPRIAAAVLAICAGADGFATKNASYAEAVDAADRGAAADDADTVHADKNNAESNDRSTTEKVSLLASLHSSLRRAAHTSDALRRDAMQRARKVYAAGGDAVSAADRNALAVSKKVHEAVLSAATREVGFFHRDGRVVNRLFVSPKAAADDAASRVYLYLLAKNTAAEVSKVVCGPIWLAATQADLVSVIAGAISVHVCNASLRVFLPARGVPLDGGDLGYVDDLVEGDGGKSGVASLTPDAIYKDTVSTVAAVTSSVTSAVSSGFVSTQSAAHDVTSGFTKWASRAVRAVRGDTQETAPTLRDEIGETLLRLDSDLFTNDASTGEQLESTHHLPQNLATCKITLSRDALVRVVNDPNVQSLAQRPIIIMALMSDSETAQFVTCEKTRKVLRLLRREAGDNSGDADNDETVADDDIDAVLVSAKRVLEVLLTSGDPDILSCAAKHGILDGTTEESEEETTRQNIQNHETAKSQRYSGYHNAVATVREKYSTKPDTREAAREHEAPGKPPEPEKNWYDFTRQHPSLFWT